MCLAVVITQTVAQVYFHTVWVLRDHSRVQVLEITDGAVVTVLCDGAGRYAGKLYNTQFLATRGLPQPPWLQHPMQLPDGLLESCIIPGSA